MLVGALPQTPLGELTALTRLYRPSWIKGPYFQGEWKDGGGNASPLQRGQKVLNEGKGSMEGRTTVETGGAITGEEKGWRRNCLAVVAPARRTV